METHVYKLEPHEQADWLKEDDEGEEFRAFTRRVVAANLPHGVRVEIYSSDRQRLLEAFTVS